MNHPILPDGFRASDLPDLAQRGVTLESATWQYEQLRAGVPTIELTHACTVDDGIVQPTSAQQEQWRICCQTAAANGEITLLVAASGSASRMFGVLESVRKRVAPCTREALQTAASGGDHEAQRVLNLFDNLAALPFYTNLSEFAISLGTPLSELLARGEYGEVIARLLDESGLGYATAPKALIEYYRYPDETRCFAEEQLCEAARWCADRHGVARFHFTVQEGAQERFEARLAQYQSRHPQLRSERSYSTQNPATDTLALTSDGALLRDADGKLVWRPGGHGALLRNLAAVDSPIIYLKTIDNVAPERASDTVRSRHRELITGCLIELKTLSDQWLQRLTSSDSISISELHDALAFITTWFGITCPTPVQSDFAALREWLIERFNRPLRVCGMVKNDGEPGGGPLWIRSHDGTRWKQIIEQSQVNPSDPRQAAILQASTHFNPVEIACSIRDFSGQPFELAQFVDPDLCIIANKHHAGQPVKILEWPGLWNGSMAYWNTVFLAVEVPGFLPIKSVFDYLRREK